MPDSVIVKRSARRKRSVSVQHKDGAFIVSIPDSFTAAEEAEWVEKMVTRLQGKLRKNELDDEALAARAAALSRTHFDSAVQPASVRWVSNQNSRWGSATPSEGTIRINHRLGRAPSYVLDYVLVHELAHFVELNHTRRFWGLVARYPRAEEAKAFLDGVSHAARMADDAGETPPPSDL